MDKLEKYIRENKAEFDEYSIDSSKMWASINAELNADETKIVPFWKSNVFRAVASVLIIIGVYGLINISSVGEESMEKNLAKKELMEIDSYYQNMVQAQIKLVEKNAKLNANDKREFLEFMDDLDEEYKTLINDLDDNLDNERVLTAIIDNYKKRIELIENLLLQISDSKENTDEDTYVL